MGKFYVQFIVLQLLTLRASDKTGRRELLRQRSIVTDVSRVLERLCSAQERVWK